MLSRPCEISAFASVVTGPRFFRDSHGITLFPIVSGKGGLHRYKPVYFCRVTTTFRQISNPFLPDKEFRYLRTIIVIADVHWRFGDWRKPLPLTFQHWSGVSPYTSPCGFAETCVFGKQSLGKLSLRPVLRRARHIANVRLAFLPSSLTKVLPFTLGSSPSPPVSVLVRLQTHEPKKFFLAPCFSSFIRTNPDVQKHLGRMPSGFAYPTPSMPLRKSNNARRILECVTPSNVFIVSEY